MSSPTPMLATRITTGNAHACAVLATGALECWGYNHYGQVGSGSISIRVTSPEVVTGLGATVAAVATGDMHTCALTTTKRVLCWGQNDHGQLGRGNGVDQGGTPQTIPDNTEHDVDLGDGEVAAQVVCGAEHTCARTSQGDVFCWGRGEQGQLGHEDLENFGDEIGESLAGRGPVELGEAAVELSVGAYHTCALLVSGAVRCWGRANLGQLGQGSVANIGDQRGSMPPPDVPYF